jgi:hypothetical protein
MGEDGSAAEEVVVEEATITMIRELSSTATMIMATISAD